jgi:LPS-assembly protein
VNTIPQHVHAEKVATEKWNISADRVVRYENPNSIVAQGSVILEKNEKVVAKPIKSLKTSSWSELLEEDVEAPAVRADQVEIVDTPVYHTTVTINADWMVYDVELESIKAKGNVHVTTAAEQLFAKEVTLNLTDETGKFTDATILRKELSLHLEGKSIEKTGFDTYRIDDGWVITCKLENGETPPWSFSSSNTDITQGGYAVLKNARFNIRNVPILYSPYMILPVKNTRQSGFLYPYFSTSTNSGMGLNLPFFLNISDSADATFFPEYYANRGFMPGVEFRYVSAITDKGMFTASYLNDQLSDPSETQYFQDTGFTHDNTDRYWIRGKANHTFGDSWQSRLDVDIVSDQDYLTEFNTGVTGFRSSYDRYLQTFGRAFQNDTDNRRQNSFKTLRSWSGMSLETNLLAINDASTNASSTNTPLWKLPSIAFTGALPLGETKFNFDWNTAYVDYWREDGVGGHRLDLHPTISTPIPLSPYLETLAEVALRDTFYSVQTYGDAEWDNNDTQNRLIPEYRVETATTLERDFSTGEGEFDGFTHQVRPFVKYGYIPNVDQKDLPKFDDVDRIADKNAITYGVDNFLNRLSPETTSRRTVWDNASLQIEQSYDLRDSASDRPFTPILSKLGWAPVDYARLTYKASYDVYDNNFDAHTFGGEYRNSRGDHFNLDYSFREAGLESFEEIEQINARVQAPITNTWIAGGEVQHSLSQDETIKANGSLTYLAPCWSVKFESQYTPTDTVYIVLFSLANIGIPLGVGF